jgi:hypothetical protein
MRRYRSTRVHLLPLFFVYLLLDVRVQELSRSGGRLEKARRVVAKVEHHPGELFSRVGLIVTSLSLSSRAVVWFYQRRGTAEQ